MEERGLSEVEMSSPIAVVVRMDVQFQADVHLLIPGTGIIFLSGGQTVFFPTLEQMAAEVQGYSGQAEFLAAHLIDPPGVAFQDPQLERKGAIGTDTLSHKRLFVLSTGESRYCVGWEQTGEELLEKIFYHETSGRIQLRMARNYSNN